MPRPKKEPEPTKLICDFVGGAVGHRFRHDAGRGHGLPKAIGFKAGKDIKVVDATPGLGRDAFMLASLGVEVTMIERSPQMHTLLKDAMARAREAGPEYAEVMDRMTLIHGDSIALLPTLDAEIILVDPMHPPRRKSSLVKNEMRVLREIVGTDDDSATLMKVALESASKRVVLKWPLRGEAMEGIRGPSHQLKGKSTRYDVFMLGG